MNGVSAVYSLARADYLERTRRSSFYLILGLTVLAGYFYLPANATASSAKTLAFTLAFGGPATWYRGIYNSAWVGTQVALFATIWLSLAGFYLVKNSVERDERTGVGQIIATTRLNKRHYTLGKALSNFSLLATIALTLALIAGIMQLVRGEELHLDLLALLSPFVLILLPTLAVVSALAILFETIAWLRGTLGNILYAALYTTILSITFTVNLSPFSDVLGVSFPIQQMLLRVKAVVPGFNGNINLGTRFNTTVFQTFQWAGSQWTSEVIEGRLLWIGIALALALLAALFFTRFDPASGKRGRAASTILQALLPGAEQETPMLAATQVHLTPLPAQAGRGRWGTVLIGEMRLLLKSVPWWWFPGAAALIVLCLLLPFDVARDYLFPVAWLWALPTWTSLGNREARYQISQLLFSTAHPLLRQLGMQWLAGVLIALLTASGMLVHFSLMGDWTGLLATGIGALFVPALALASGVWTGNSRLFEVVFVACWYIGAINHVAALDFMGTTVTTASMGIPLAYLAAAGILLLVAVVGRQRQLQV